MSKIRGTVILERGSVGHMTLKRWKEEDGFYIVYTSYYQSRFPTIEARGETLKHCFRNYDSRRSRAEDDKYDREGGRYDLHNMFSTYLSDKIIDTFKLSDEDIEFITDLGEWGEF